MKITPDNATQIAQEKMITAGEILKTYREKKGFTLAEISAATKIPMIRLKQIESNEFGNFEAQVFTRGFIKNYAEYLGLNVGKVLAIYRRSTATVAVGNNKPALSEQKEKNEKKSIKEQVEKAKEKIKKFELTPTNVASIAGILFFTIIAVYLSIQFYKFQQPPQLSLISPENNSTFQTDLIEVKGVTEVGAAVKVNEQVVPVNTSGEFLVEIKLNQGDNKLTVKAYKNSNEDKASIIERKISFKKESTSTQNNNGENNSNNNGTSQNTPTPQKHKVSVGIIDEDTWITLIVDDKQMIAWVVSPGQVAEYEFTNMIEFTTGKPRSTTFKIDGKDMDITINNQGTGGKACLVEGGIVNCE